MAADRGRRAGRPRAALPACLAALLGLAAAPAAAQSVDERLQACLACHDTPALADQPPVPAIAGQPELFVMYQLFFFREGRRKDPTMSELARGLSDADLQALSAAIAALPPDAAPAGPADPGRYERGRALAQAHRCDTCHTRDYAGREQMPRLAGQRERYLLKALADYKAGNRIGIQAAMAEVLGPLDEAELADLAHFLSHYRPAGGQ
jgi:cytochrome c553